jgi:glucuronoarabinoxylan endo-1,4-beta-xylanase
MDLILRVDLGTTHQKMDGFGFCQGFGRARILGGSEGLPPERTHEVLDLLFGTDGAAVSMLRLCIGCSPADGPGTMKSIAHTDPGGPDQPLIYDWDGDDCGQVWLAREAVRYGVRRIFAHPLSAPAYMMRDRPDGPGGLVQGMPGTPPAAGDWRPAFAEYLLRYVRFYADSGVRITDLGLADEPDLLMHHPDRAVRYPRLRLEPRHVVDFVKVLGRAIERSGTPVGMVCCNARSWDQQAVYTAAVEADEVAARYVAVHAGNSYLTHARRPLPTARPTWMAAWDPDVVDHTGSWNGDWDRGDPSDGILLAEDINDALTTAGVSGYCYLFGASARAGTRALIWLDGPEYRVAKRFWAFAAYSRFIRPGAYRVEAHLAGTGLKVAAFRRPDGAVVINLLNLRADAATVTLDRTHVPGACIVRPWLTDADHALCAMAAQSCTDPVVAPARSLTTLVLDPAR